MEPKAMQMQAAAAPNEINKGFLMDEIIHAVSNHEMFLSKVAAGPEPLPIQEAFEMARKDFQKK